MAPDRPDLRAIDRHALAAPASVTGSVPLLAAYLTRSAHNDTEKARAIYRWITANIAYDARAYFSGRMRDAALKPGDVLKRRRGLCDGFAGLFEALAREAGLDAVVVPGWGKGLGYRPGTLEADTANHAWNAVKVEGRWRLVDATWGAGVVDEDVRRFRPAFDESYFFTPPGQFIYGHLPQDPRWQLIDPPISLRVFDGQPLLRPVFFATGLELESHRQGLIRTAGQLEVTLGASKPVQVVGTLLGGGRKQDSSRVWVQNTGRAVRVEVLFPAPGAYTLRLYAKPWDQAGAYAWALDYRIVAARGASARSRFPEPYEAYQRNGAWLHKPLQGRLVARRKQTFKLRVPEAEQVAVVSAGQWTFLERQDGLFLGQTLIHRGETTVFARYPGQEQFQGLLRYRGE